MDATSGERARRVPDGGPSWSPNGRYLVFHRGGTAFLAHSDGTRSRPVASRASLIWSPDGRRLLFYGHEGEIRLARPDRSGSRIVARGDRPTWSPDSRFFAYASGRAIVIVDADGAPVRRLEIPPGPGCPPDICVYSELNAQWSPAGTAILFKHSTTWYASKGSSSLWTVGPDGANLWRVPSEFTAGQAAWSPTGSQIAFVQFDQFEYEALRIAGTGGTSSRTLASAWAFVWSPRGDMILAFGGRDATYAELVRVRDGWSRRLGRVHEVSWAPDGRRIAFARGGAIWIADRLGNRQRRVATGVSPSWSPRGDTIAFAAASCGPRQGIWLLRVATGATRRVTRGCAVVR